MKKLRNIIVTPRVGWPLPPKNDNNALDLLNWAEKQLKTAKKTKVYDGESNRFMVAKFDVLSQFFKPVYKICMTLTSFIHFQGDLVFEQ